MESVSKNEGRTVIFVSHQMGTIAQLCNRCILMDNGQMVMKDQTQIVIEKYMQKVNQSTVGSNFYTNDNPEAHKSAFVQNIQLVDNEHKTVSTILHDEPIRLLCKIKINDYQKGLQFALVLLDRNQRRVFTRNFLFSDIIEEPKSGVSKVFLIEISANFIMPGVYSWAFATHVNALDYFEYYEDVCQFTITDNGSEFSAQDNGFMHGVVFLNDYKIIRY